MPRMLAKHCGPRVSGETCRSAPALSPSALALLGRYWGGGAQRRWGTSDDSPARSAAFKVPHPPLRGYFPTAVGKLLIALDAYFASPSQWGGGAQRRWGTPGDSPARFAAFKGNLFLRRIPGTESSRLAHFAVKLV